MKKELGATFAKQHIAMLKQINIWKITIKTKNFIKNYDENGNAGYFLEVGIDYAKELFNLHKDLPFLRESKKVKKVEKLICDIEDKKKYVIHIRALKQALNHGLKLKKVHRVIDFNQKACLKHEY